MCPVLIISNLHIKKPTQSSRVNSFPCNQTRSKPVGRERKVIKHLSCPSPPRNIFARQENRYARMLPRWEVVPSTQVHLQLSGNFWLWFDFIIRLHKKSVLKQKVCACGVGGSAGLQSFALFQPLPLLLLIPSHLCCPDPDHNLGGWCYRKPRTPGKIVLLHGDSPVFISSLTGCLKESGEGRQKVGE